jgi:hypothetical protein
MRSALHFAPRVPVEVAYPKDAIVVCRNCGKPLYRLQQSLYLGEPMARSAWKYVPVTPTDLKALTERSDLEPGQRAAILAMSAEDQRTHCERIPELKAGDFADCPACKESFVFGKVNDDADGGARFGDKSFTIALAVIPPQGQARRVH